MHFKLRQMEIFRAIMITGSISGAARMLFISQPVVSRALSYMEDSLKISLFVRKSGALIPTDDARIIFREIEDVYISALRVDELVTNLRSKKKSKISFCSSPALGINLVPLAIRNFLEKNEDIRFEYRTVLVKDMPMDLLGRASAFAISVWPINHPNLLCETLFEGEMVLVVPNTHPLASAETVQLKDLDGQQMITYRQDLPLGAFIRDLLLGAGVKVNSIVEINRSELACSLVHQGVGIALVNRFCVDEDIWNRLTVKEIDFGLPASVCLITSRFEVLSQESKNFIQFIRDAYGKSRLI
ncbi:LysR family transcriptional regulator [Noviherbaspirillum sp. Root189]|uniref:LysR family transcriptional regulator n=1 Tax=Noviherbaspirillum sp. Root189 TaxID=1736487 RepID=UPI00070F74EA|nr:LysR family transcriptional regulator [Noviherbaspirillum sp. Root189]KRB81545.1 LysR family transcriptional regulator [Noviherbaspirillum sp. Root189]